MNEPYPTRSSTAPRSRSTRRHARRARARAASSASSSSRSTTRRASSSSSVSSRRRWIVQSVARWRFMPEGSRSLARNRTNPAPGRKEVPDGARARGAPQPCAHTPDVRRADASRARRAPSKAHRRPRVELARGSRISRQRTGARTEPWRGCSWRTGARARARRRSPVGSRGASKARATRRARGARSGRP